MQIKKLPYSKVPNFSARDKAYVEESPALRPFYKYPVKLEAFPDVIADKQKDRVDRETLVEVLQRQYSGLEVPQIVSDNIEKLRNENTFTIITAHQPSLFTGPLYYVFKIISAINLAKKLKANYPEFEFIPVFISSGEDHDFAEVNHLHLFNQTLTWESGQTGPVGHMDTSSLAGVLERLGSVLGESENAKHINNLIQKTHTDKVNYARAAYELAVELFKKEGLVVLNTNDPALKRLFIPAIKEEIFHEVSRPLVEATFVELEKAGFPAQAMPRDINFFYIKDNVRERIVYENEKYTVLNTDLRFTKEELETEIDRYPEHFSPNVVMRPIYQEMILPNLAYVGGGGEIAYWLERKSQFAHFGINFPMLVRRDSAMWIDAGSLKKMGKANLEIKDLWKDTDRLIKEYVVENGEVEISLEDEKATLKAMYEQLAQKAKTINQSLEKLVLAEHAKANKSIDQIETRLLRAEKQNHENTIKQIRTLKEKLFPHGGLQERYDNFLPYYLKYGDEFFETLKMHFDPMDKQFKIFIES
ncbi:MAG: bacillithiol biosynthesis cysteine-adding enzyme BshC [Bacteroidota bacterium]